MFAQLTESVGTQEKHDETSSNVVADKPKITRPHT
jgi:hypothetical protein